MIVLHQAFCVVSASPASIPDIKYLLKGTMISRPVMLSKREKTIRRLSVDVARHYKNIVHFDRGFGRVLWSREKRFEFNISIIDLRHEILIKMHDAFRISEVVQREHEK